MHKKGFTPLEKIIYKLVDIIFFKTNGGLMFLSAHTVRFARKEFSNGIKKRSSLTGFTLIEILVAAVIMAITVSGIFAVFIASGRFVNRSQRRLSAINIAQAEIEKRRGYVRSDTWGDANDGANLGLTGGAWTASVAGPNILGAPTQFHYMVALDPRFAIPVSITTDNEKCRQVFMRVQWNEPQ